VITRRCASLFALLCVSIYGNTAAPKPFVPAPLKKPASANHPPTTSENVLALLIQLDNEMLNMAAFAYTATPENKRPMVGPCAGKMRPGLIESARVLPRFKTYLTGKALSCYVVNYLGCDTGKWIGEISEDSHEMFYPFKGARVTIVERAPDRVVADVVEASQESVFDGVYGYAEEGGKVVELPAEEKARETNSSRYTFVRDAAGVWRVADRKASWDWSCEVRDGDWYEAHRSSNAK